MARDRVAGFPAPAAQSIRAADGMASSGFIMSGVPGGPNPLIPHSAQVDGMNCIGPSAPALDGPLLAPSPLSIWPIRSEEHTSELQSQSNLVCRLLLEKKKNRSPAQSPYWP